MLTLPCRLMALLLLLGLLLPTTVGRAQDSEDATTEGSESDLVLTQDDPDTIITVVDDPDWWLQIDYLLWWMKGNRLPAMVTTSPPGTARADAGVLGVSGTTILFGDSRVDENYRNGARIKLGHWLTSDTAIEASYFTFGDGANTGNYFNQSTGNPILARPFYNADPLVLGEDSQLVAFPSVVDGQIQILTDSEAHSAGILYRQNLRQTNRRRIDLLAGYRYFRYREGLNVQEDLVVTEVGGLVAQGTTIRVNDRFDTSNEFHGGEIGLSCWCYYDDFTIDALLKVAVGGVNQQLDINGTTVVTVPGGSAVTSTGGLLAQPTNIGQFYRNEVAILPELNLNVHYRIGDRVIVTAGYTLLYLSDALRTGDQIDRTVNATQLAIGGGGLTGAPRPAVSMNDTAIWAQGLNLGVVIEK